MDHGAWESVSRLVGWLIAWVVVGVLLIHLANHGLVVGDDAVLVIHGLFAELTRAIPLHLNGS